MQRLLIANRGEIAIRIARAAADLGIESFAVYAPEDAASLHRFQADRSVALEGRGAAAYLDIDDLVSLAIALGCAVHPGYGFLSENAQFAKKLEAAGLTFVGPSPKTLAALGNKSEARALAAQCGIPVLRGSDGPATLEEAHAFLKALDGAPLIIKAVSGGGGRGMRVVEDAEALDAAYSRCASEADLAFGDPSLYLEEYLPDARHVEVQILGDGSGAVSHLWERECSIQRRRQKLVEIAPAPQLDEALRNELTDAALRLGQAANYRSAGTVEFLVTHDRFAFIEANARLQVEHTVTEEVTGIDLVRAQLEIAEGATLAQLGLEQANIPAPKGFAIQARINMETLGEDGSVKPAGGTLSLFEPPSGPGLRTDSFGYTGYATSPAFDSLLAKLIVHAPHGDYAAAVRKGYRALCETRIEGVATNLGFLRNLFADAQFNSGAFDTGFVDASLGRLARPAQHATLAQRQDGATEPDAAVSAGKALAGAQVDAIDPLAVLDHGKSNAASATTAPAALALVEEDLPPGVAAVAAPMQGTIVAFDVGPGDEVWSGRQVLVMEAMKMEHVVHAEVSGVVQRLGVEPGDTVFEGHPLIYLAETEIEAPTAGGGSTLDLESGAPPTSPRSSSARPLATTRTAPKRWPNGAKPAIAPPGRTSPTFAMKAPSSSTARWLWPGSGGGAASTT